MKIASLAVVLCATCALYGQSDYGAILDSLRHSKTIGLENVTVMKKVVRDIVPAQVLSGDELQRMNSLSVSDALRYFSGVQVKDYGGVGGLKTVNIRSMGSQHVGVFYDGIQITNAQNGTVDLGKFSLDNMEMITVYNAQKSDIFQSARDFASASAVYMVSRTPVFRRNDKDNFNFKLRGGSFDYINASALWEHKINARLSTSANVEMTNTSGKYKFRYSRDGGYDTTQVRQNGDVFFARAEAAVFGKLRDGEWQAKGYFYTSEQGYPGFMTKQADTIAFLNQDRQRDRNLFVQMKATQQLTPWYSYLIRAKYANDYMNYVMPKETTTLQPANNHYDQQEIYLTAANLFRINRWWTANVAADFQMNSLDVRSDSKIFSQNFPQPRRYTTLAAGATSVKLRQFAAQASFLYTHVHETSRRGMEMAADKDVFSPTLILSWTPWKKINLDLRGFYKKIFRLPTFNDLYYVSLGNSELKPEYATEYNLGAVYRKHFQGSWLASVNFSLDAYYNEITDKIIARPQNSMGVWSMMNIGYVEIRGVDFTANPQFVFGQVLVNGKLTYTYQRAQDFTPQDRREDMGDAVENYYGHQISYVPWHSGSAIVNVAWKDWNFNYSFIYTGERYSFNANVPVNYIMPWYTSDMSVSKDFALPRGNTLRVTAEVNNIFNQQYEVVNWFPMPGTNFKVILSLTL